MLNFIKYKLKLWKLWKLYALESDHDFFCEDPDNKTPNACCPYCKGSYWLKDLEFQIDTLRQELKLPSRFGR